MIENVSLFAPGSSGYTAYGSRVPALAVSSDAADGEKSLTRTMSFMVDFIRQAPGLSRTDKQQLIGLTALVDEFGGKDKAKLFEAIAAMVMMMESVNRARDPDEWSFRLSHDEAMTHYWQVREQYTGDEDMRLSIGAVLQAMLQEQEGLLAAV